MGTEHMYYFVPVPDWWVPGALIRSCIFGAAIWILLLILPHPNGDEVSPVCLATELHWFFMSSLTVKLNMVAQWLALLPHSKRVAGLNPGPSRVCSVWSFSPCVRVGLSLGTPVSSHHQKTCMLGLLLLSVPNWNLQYVQFCLLDEVKCVHTI